MSAVETVEPAAATASGPLAHNYHPLPASIASAEGAWMTGLSGERYLDMLGGYSALNFGHRHPAVVAAAREQLGNVTLVSRAFENHLLHQFAAELVELIGAQMMVPMNTGAEAVETALKVARKWAYDVKGVPAGRAEIIVADGNFHGRTTTIVSFSGDPDATGGFGPFTPGFRTVPFGDADAIAREITPHTAAVLIEPVQGEAGVVIPPSDYLPRVRETCTQHDVLLIADEVQSGLARTGRTLACEHWGVTPDLVVLGKALGGGVVPVSAVAGRADVLSVLHPGQHGSTFGGNPLACAVGLAVVGLLRTGEFQHRATVLGQVLDTRLTDLVDRGLLRQRRVLGLWAGVDIEPGRATGRQVCERLLSRGVLCKDTHGSTVRLSPPIVIDVTDLHWALDQLEDVLTEVAR